MTQVGEENRILREWTPVILRTVLLISGLLLAVGMITMFAREPAYYVTRFRAIQHGAPMQPSQSLPTLVRGSLGASPHDIMTLGLMILTLVPLARVAFTFFLFLLDRNWVFTVVTAYVLTMLILGVMLGRIG